MAKMAVPTATDDKMVKERKKSLMKRQSSIIMNKYFLDGQDDALLSIEPTKVGEVEIDENYIKQLTFLEDKESR